MVHLATEANGLLHGEIAGALWQIQYRLKHYVTRISRVIPNPLSRLGLHSTESRDGEARRCDYL